MTATYWVSGRRSANRRLPDRPGEDRYRSKPAQLYERYKVLEAQGPPAAEEQNDGGLAFKWRHIAGWPLS
jgi:hypothetical protein